MPVDGGNGTGPDSSAAPAPPVSCDFGPFGEQTAVNLQTLGAQKLCKIAHRARLPLFADAFNILFLPSLVNLQLSFCQKAAHMPSTLARPFGVLIGVLSIQMIGRVRICLFGVGHPLTSRVEPDCSYKYYLAVAPLCSRTHSPEIGIKVPRPSRACIQLWSLGPSAGVGGSDDDKGEMHCEMVLCIDSGPALELKWCPLPSHDPVCPESLPYWLLGL